MKAIIRFGSALDNKLNFDNGPNNPPTSLIFGPQYTTQVIYEFSPPEVRNELLKTITQQN